MRTDTGQDILVNILIFHEVNQMINLKQGCLLIVLMGVIGLPPCAQALPALNPKPFAGADVGYRTLGFHAGHGDHIFKKNLPQTGLQIGMRFWDYFGFQFGYERTRREGRSTQLGPGEIVLARHLNAPEHHSTESGIQGGYFDLLGFIPIYPIARDFELLLGIGVVRTKLLYKDTIVAINDSLTLDPPTRTFNEKQSHARVFAGFQKLFKVNNPKLVRSAGIRALASWENTAQHKNEKPLEVADSFLTAKNSYVFSVGIVLSM